MKRHVITGINPTWLTGHIEELNEKTQEWQVALHSDWVVARTHGGPGENIPRDNTRVELPQGMLPSQYIEPADGFIPSKFHG